MPPLASIPNRLHSGSPRRRRIGSRSQCGCCMYTAKALEFPCMAIGGWASWAAWRADRGLRKLRHRWRDLQADRPANPCRKHRELNLPTRRSADSHPWACASALLDTMTGTSSAMAALTAALRAPDELSTCSSAGDTFSRKRTAPSAADIGLPRATRLISATASRIR